MMAMSVFKKRDKVQVPPLAREKKGRIGELTSTFSEWIWRGFSKTWWPRSVSGPSTKISYHTARSVYRNDDKHKNLAGFGKRIINSAVDFIQLPWSAQGDDIVDEFLNGCMRNYWRAGLTQAFRDSMRDGDTVVRLRRHDLENKLVSASEWEAGYLEVVPPESCAIYYKTAGDVTEIEVAYIRHEIDQIVSDADVNGRVLKQPQIKTHIIIEELTPQTFRYFDETLGEWIDDLEQINDWGFVPLVEMMNDYDAVTKGGVSDLEAPLAFIMAFHDVMAQSLIAHKAHSIPKAVFNVNDMTTFIANNWPDAFEQDEGGRPIIDTFNGNISWKGTEILFLDAEEKAGFMEVTSVLGDSKVLLDFLLTCISISSETPKSALMNQTAEDADEMLAFSKKIARRRNNFTDSITLLCKMILVINHMEPVKVPLYWEEISPALALETSQVAQQETMTMEVMATREVVSDRTVRQHMRQYVPEMKSNDQEAKDATKNKQMPVASPNSASSVPATKGTDSGGKGE